MRHAADAILLTHQGEKNRESCRLKLTDHLELRAAERELPPVPPCPTRRDFEEHSDGVVAFPQLIRRAMYLRQFRYVKRSGAIHSYEQCCTLQQIRIS